MMNAAIRSKRRRFLQAGAATAVLACIRSALPLAAFAQQPRKVWRIGVLSPRAAEYADGEKRALTKHLGELGYVEGQNLHIEWRFADGQHERMPALAAELVQGRVDLILVSGTNGARAAQRATKTIPIVAIGMSSPVRDGLAVSLSRPGGNVTGMSNLGADTGPKRLDLLLSAAPKVTRIGYLVNPENVAIVNTIPSLRAALQGTGRELVMVEARTAGEIDKALAAIAKARVGALMVAIDPMLGMHDRRIAEFALREKLPSIFGVARTAEAGALLTYGTDASEQGRRAVVYIDKIFKGTKPGDLPIEQPTKFELVVNLRTAKALGITIPQSLLVSADKVIE